jgi:putative transposase
MATSESGKEETMKRGPDPVKIELNTEEKEGLKKLASRPSTSQQIAQRARIILAANAGQNNAQIARAEAVSVNKVRKWRRRWAELKAVPLDEMSLVERLQDLPRSGSPGKFSAEQLAQIIALACEDPRASGYPVSHWTPKEVAAEAIKRGIVESISPRQVGRFLKRGRVTTASQPVLAEYDRNRPGSV